MHAYIYAFILQSMPNSEEHHNEEHGPPRPPPGHQETGIARRPPMRDSQADHKGFPVQETLSPNYWRIQRLIDHSSPNLLAGCSHNILARFRSTTKNTSFKYWRDSEMSMPKGGQYVGKYDVAFRQTMSDGARKLCTAASAPRGYPNQLPSP